MTHQQQLNMRLRPQKAARTIIIITLLLLSFSLLTLFALWRLFSPAEQAASLSLPEQEQTTPPWLFVTVAAGDNLATLFSQHDLSAQSLQQILNINEHTQHLQKLQPGQTIQLLKDENNTLEQLIVTLSQQESLIITQANEHYEARIKQKKIETRKYFKTATIEHSLYRSANNAGIPDKIILQLSQMFAWNIDFSTELRPGDRVTLLYEENYSDGERIGVGNIIAAKFINQNDIYTAIRYANFEGKKNYYTADGKNTQKALLRYPINYSHISSPFELERLHPILGDIRPHKGIDLAAALGTPIKAVGDGKINYIGKNGGYGNMIRIKHRNGEYQSLYAHMLRFAKGLSKGNTVKQGQIIGYVGQSGLATGPHVHFELIKNGEALNPVIAKLPQAEPIDENQLGSFLSTADQLMTQLDLYTQTNYYN